MTFIVKKDSWHYRWIAFIFAARHFRTYKFYMDGYTPIEFYEMKASNRPWNFCNYWRSVLLWPGLGIGLTTLGVIALITVLSVYGAGIILFPLAMAVGMLLGLFAIVAFLGLAGHTIGIVTDGVKQTSFFMTLYSSYKNKFCPDVEYTTEEKK